LTKQKATYTPACADRQDQSREEYEKSTGRGSDESVPEYIARMGGIAALYFAILQTPLASLIPTLDGRRPTPDQLPTLLGPSLRSPAAWSWLANSLRDPMAGMQPTAHLMTAWIEIVGKSAVDLYRRKQLDKVLDVMYRQGIEGEKIKGDGEAARQRLSLVLQEWKSGGLAYPKGRNWE
jgi:nucleoporin GLE1